MEDFIHKFGIDGRLILSQAVNFLALFVILRIVAYRPLIELLNKRKARIQEGLTRADEADRRLGEIEKIKAEELRKAEVRAEDFFKATESRAREYETQTRAAAHVKAEAVIHEAERLIQAKKEEARMEMEREAVSLVKAALLKTVTLSPKAVHDTLIQEAIASLQKQS